MRKQQPTPIHYVQPYRYPSPNIPLSAIKRFARQIAEKFHPEKIILFGSYAYGTPHEESDVDREITEKGKVLYEAQCEAMGAESRA